MRYRFIERHQKAYPITLMCSVLDVSTSGYYAWRERPPGQRALANRELDDAIRLDHRRKARIGSLKLGAYAERIPCPRVPENHELFVEPSVFANLLVKHVDAFHEDLITISGKGQRVVYAKIQLLK